MNKAFLKTPLGMVLIEGDDMGISRLSITDDADFPESLIAPELKNAVSQLNEYFYGNRKEFQLKLNPEGSDFQKKVWKLLSEIPYGKTCSYHELSQNFGNTKAIRAVAAANGKNPLWILIPCHRVIGADGSLTGYAGGLWRKQWLLQHEQASIQHTLF